MRRVDERGWHNVIMGTCGYIDEESRRVEERGLQHISLSNTYTINLTKRKSKKRAK